MEQNNLLGIYSQEVACSEVDQMAIIPQSSAKQTGRTPDSR
ncbi:MAG: hypothetical protein ACJAVK_002971, partial [Akkermansiaceae bacterium]